MPDTARLAPATSRPRTTGPGAPPHPHPGDTSAQLPPAPAHGGLHRTTLAAPAADYALALFRDEELVIGGSFYIGTALTATRTLDVSQKRFEFFLEKHPAAVRILAGVLAHRLREAERAYGTMQNSSADRINEFIYWIHSQWPRHIDGVPVISNISQGDIARFLRISRAGVEAQISYLKEIGAIRCGYRKVEILDLEYFRLCTTVFDVDVVGGETTGS